MSESDIIELFIQWWPRSVPSKVSHTIYTFLIYIFILKILALVPVMTSRLFDTKQFPGPMPYNYHYWNHSNIFQWNLSAIQTWPFKTMHLNCRLQNGDDFVQCFNGGFVRTRHQLWTPRTRGFQTARFRKVGQSNHMAAECGIITDTDKNYNTLWYPTSNDKVGIMAIFDFYWSNGSTCVYHGTTRLNVFCQDVIPSWLVLKWLYHGYIALKIGGPIGSKVS